MTEPPQRPVPKTLHIKTFGCQMNEYDSERVAGLLRGQRYELTDREDDADLILVNTCAIREKAEDKVFSKLGELGRLKRERPGLMVGVMGCMAQLHKAEIQRRAPQVDLVFGTVTGVHVDDDVVLAERAEVHLAMEQPVVRSPGARVVDGRPAAFREQEPRLRRVLGAEECQGERAEGQSDSDEAAQLCGPEQTIDPVPLTTRAL